MLSASDESEAVFKAVAEGAVAYVPKEADRDEVCDAIVAAARGEVVLSPEIQAELASEIRTAASQERSPLTAREREVLKLTAEGLSAPEIGFQPPRQRGDREDPHAERLREARRLRPGRRGRRGDAPGHPGVTEAAPQPRPYEQRELVYVASAASSRFPCSSASS